MNRLANVINASLAFSSRTLQQHPKRITAVIAALMLGGGGGAYAVASFAPDASDLPVRQVQESVQAFPSNAAADDLNIHQFKLFRSDVTRSSDTADTLLKRLGIDDADAAAFLRSDATASTLLWRSGRNVTTEASDNNHLIKLTARWSADTDGQFNRLVIEKTAQGFQSSIETKALIASTRLAGGTIQSSLFAATDESNIPDAIAIQVAEIFSGDIDFRRSLRKGDRFSIVYETLEGDGEPLRSGRVLSTEFINNGKTFQAMWFQESGVGTQTAKAARSTDSRSQGGYYTLDGQSLQRSYLASPLVFSRVSSGFGMRFHPIQKNRKAHLGVDFAAPTGTPVRSVSDARVSFAGVQNGYGNVVFLEHSNNKTTVYAHLSRINVRQGQRIEQGQNIGLVGATGWATGPHLHFEFRVNGAHQDPLTIANSGETVPISAAARPAFALRAKVIRQELLAAASMVPTN